MAFKLQLQSACVVFPSIGSIEPHPTPSSVSRFGNTNRMVEVQKARFIKSTEALLNNVSVLVNSGKSAPANCVC